MNNINETVGYDQAKKNGFVGFAHIYLQTNKKENIQPDADVYKKLVDIDSKLGTTNSFQLYWCLAFTTRPDIIKISIEVSCKL